MKVDGDFKIQASFSDLEYAAKKKVTRRERFLGEIDAITPWSALVAQVDPFYPKGEGRGRPPIGVERMLRMYVAQQCLGFSDEGIEDAIYDSQAIRGFVGIDLIPFPVQKCIERGWASRRDSTRATAMRRVGHPRIMSF